MRLWRPPEALSAPFPAGLRPVGRGNPFCRPVQAAVAAESAPVALDAAQPLGGGYLNAVRAPQALQRRPRWDMA